MKRIAARMHHGCVLSLLAIATMCPTLVFGARFQPHSILVSSGDGWLLEYTRSGTLLQSFVVPTPGDSNERDLVVDPVTGDALVYNGTFDPFLSTLDPVSATWSHRTALGWSTVANTTYGGIATDGTYVYVTDMRTFGDGGADEAQGIVRFEIDTDNWVRFAEDIAPIDLNLGLDGVLYALHPGGSPGGTTIDAYDGSTLGFIRRIDLGFTAHRAVAVNATGEIFVADWDGDLQHLNPDGTLINSINLSSGSPPVQGSFLSDVDVSEDGTVLVVDGYSNVFLLDSTFATIEVFPVSGIWVFATFVPTAAPVSIDIDIRPFSRRNKVIPTRGKVLVAILSTDDFDAQTVNPETVRFGPAGAESRFVFFPLWDVNRDGKLDYVLRFRMRDTGIQCGDTEATLTGETFDGTPLEGADSIMTVGCRRKKKKNK